MSTVTSSLRRTNNLHKVKGLLFLAIPFALYFIPVEWLNSGHSICIYKNLTGHDCIGCGITRAIVSILHLQFTAALKYNRLVVIVLPLLTYLWIKALLKEYSYLKMA